MSQDIRIGRGMFEFARLQLKEISTKKSLSEKEAIIVRNLISRAYYSVFWIARGQILLLSNNDLIHETHKYMRK